MSGPDSATTAIEDRARAVRIVTQLRSDPTMLARYRQCALDLEQAREAPTRERDLLASIRAKILGGAV